MILLLIHPLTPPPLHVSKLDLRHSGRLRNRDNLLTGGGVSLNSSILSDLNNLGKKFGRIISHTEFHPVANICSMCHE
jgi:hypothetical protein